MFAQPYQLPLINRCENASRTHGVSPAASMLPQTFRSIAGKEFLEFLRKPHDKRCRKEALGSSNGCYSHNPLISTRTSSGKHPQIGADGFLPQNFVVSVPFPRRRLTGH